MTSENRSGELLDERYDDSFAGSFLHFLNRCLGDDSDPVKGSHLPVARVKKIMKEGEHQGMISSDAPVILAKACEMLIRDLTLQSWDCTQMTKRCTLQRQDITSAIFKSNIYNFLYDLLTPEDLKPIMENQQRGSGLSDATLGSQDRFNRGSNGLCYPKEPAAYHRSFTHPYTDLRPASLRLHRGLVGESVFDVNEVVKGEFDCMVKSEFDPPLVDEACSSALDYMPPSVVHSFSC